MEFAPMSLGGSQASAGEGLSPCKVDIGIGWTWSPPERPVTVCRTLSGDAAGKQAARSRLCCVGSVWPLRGATSGLLWCLCCQAVLGLPSLLRAVVSEGHLASGGPQAARSLWCAVHFAQINSCQLMSHIEQSQATPLAKCGCCPAATSSCTVCTMLWRVLF